MVAIDLLFPWKHTKRHHIYYLQNLTDIRHVTISCFLKNKVKSNENFLFQVTIQDVNNDVECHATGDPHYITFDKS